MQHKIFHFKVLKYKSMHVSLAYQQPRTTEHQRAVLWLEEHSTCYSIRRVNSLYFSSLYFFSQVCIKAQEPFRRTIQRRHMTANVRDVSKNCFWVKKKNRHESVLKRDTKVISWVCAQDRCGLNFMRNLYSSITFMNLLPVYQPKKCLLSVISSLSLSINKCW